MYRLKEQEERFADKAVPRLISNAAFHELTYRKRKMYELVPHPAAAEEAQLYGSASLDLETGFELSLIDQAALVPGIPDEEEAAENFGEAGAGEEY
jgi:hypothetical protein